MRVIFQCDFSVNPEGKIVKYMFVLYMAAESKEANWKFCREGYYEFFMLWG